MDPTHLMVSVAASFIAACSGASTTEPLGQEQQAFTTENLVLDAHYHASGGASYCFLGHENVLGQQFVPTRDNVAAISCAMTALGTWDSTSTVSVGVRILDAGFAVLAATTVELSNLANAAPAHVDVEFSSPIPVVPGDLYVLQLSWQPATLERQLAWLSNSGNPYPDGSAVLWCLGEPVVTPDRDQDFAIFARVEPSPAPPTFDDMNDLLDHVSTNPEQGQMTGPNEHANAGRLRAFHHMLDEAEAYFAAGQTAEGCSKLDALRGKITGRNAWFAGDTAEGLLATIDALFGGHGCG